MGYTGQLALGAAGSKYGAMGGFALGGPLGSAFGGGSSNSMFGALGPSDFLGRLTYILVAIWLALSLLLAYLYKSENSEVIFETPLIEEALEEGLSEEIPVE